MNPKHFGAPWRLAVDNESGTPWGLAPQPIGARATIMWKEFPNERQNVYISFDEYKDSDGQPDRFGVADEGIFFFCPDGVSGMERLSNPEGEGEDFVVLEYRLVHSLEVGV